MSKGGRKTSIGEVPSDIVELQVQVFDLGGPVGQEAPFDASTRRPAGFTAGGTGDHAGQRRRARAPRTSTATCYNASDRAVGRAVAPSPASRSIQQHIIRDISKSAPNGAEVICLAIAR